MKEPNSLTREIAERYHHSDRKSKKAIFNEYIQLTGFHRKYAIAKLNSCIKRREHNFNNTTIRTTKVESPQKKRKESTFQNIQLMLLIPWQESGRLLITCADNALFPKDTCKRTKGCAYLQKVRQCKNSTQEMPGK